MPHQKYEVGTLAVDGWAVTFGTARRGLGTWLATVFSLRRRTMDGPTSAINAYLALETGKQQTIAQ